MRVEEPADEPYFAEPPARGPSRSPSVRSRFARILTVAVAVEGAVFVPFIIAADDRPVIAATLGAQWTAFILCALGALHPVRAPTGAARLSNAVIAAILIGGSIGGLAAALENPGVGLQVALVAAIALGFARELLRVAVTGRTMTKGQELRRASRASRGVAR